MEGFAGRDFAGGLEGLFGEERVCWLPVDWELC